MTDPEKLEALITFVKKVAYNGCYNEDGWDYLNGCGEDALDLLKKLGYPTDEKSLNPHYRCKHQGPKTYCRKHFGQSVCMECLEHVGFYGNYTPSDLGAHGLTGGIDCKER